MAINVSNPTSASGRKTIAEILEGKFYFRRQDLTYLRTLASSGRTPLSALVAGPSEIKKSLLTLRDALIRERLPHKQVKEEVYPLAEHPDKVVPLCNLMLNDERLRPQINAHGNAVSLTRTFGSSAGRAPNLEIEALLTVFPSDEVERALMAKVHTGGTLEGFKKRLALLSSSSCRSVNDVLGASPLSRNKVLERLLPVDTSLLPDWERGDDLLELIKDTKLTAQSSTGAPLWGKKGECLEQMAYLTELFFTHMRAGTLDTLLKEQPEMFVIEVKNKIDRYDVDKLNDKTRPYVNPPAYLTIPFSWLCQHFCHALYKVGGDRPTANAYGWSAAQGGITNLVEDVKRREKAGERGWCYAYGDDGDVYMKVHGTLYRVSPDIKQMDSCVDFDTIRATLEYIKHCYGSAWGESPIWTAYLDVLLSVMEKPRLLVSGTKLYTKPADGLLSGIVGTTLFDTVKAAACYTDLLERHAQNPSDLMDEAYVARFMLARYGLVLKPGTWTPVPVQLDPEPAQWTEDGFLSDPEEALYGPGKFLGVNYVRAQGPKGPEWLPWLPEEDWLSCLLSPRSMLDQKMSITSYQRLMFDRIRGYLTTGAVFSRRVKLALDYWCDQLPGEVILMQPQGTTPPEGILLGEDSDFTYPVPEFYPTREWVFDIYSQPGNKYDRPAQPLFTEEVIAQVSEVRKLKRKIKLDFSAEKGEVVVSDYVPKTEPLDVTIGLAMVKVPPTPKLETSWKGPTPKRVAEAPQSVPIPGVPIDMAYTQTETEARKAFAKAPPVPVFAQNRAVAPVSLLSEHEGKVPVVCRTTMGGTPLVHPPTMGGVVGPRLELNATLKDEFLACRLTKFVNIPPKMQPASAAHTILNKNLYHPEWTFQSIHEGGRTYVRGLLKVIPREDRIRDKVSHTHLARDQGKVVQSWEGANGVQIRESFYIWICAHNRSLGNKALETVQSKDWSLAADAQKVPLSAYVHDPRPPPLPELDLPECPATVPYENAGGVVQMIASAVLAEAPQAHPEDIIPPPPEFSDSGNESSYLVSTDDEEYENAVLHNGEYAAIAELEKVFAAVASWSKGVPLNPPLNIERPDLENLKALLSKYRKKVEKHAPKEKESESEEPPELPPRGQRAEAPPRPERQAGSGDESHRRSASRNRRRRLRAKQSRAQRAGNRPADVEGDREGDQGNRGPSRDQPRNPPSVKSAVPLLSANPVSPASL